MDVFGDGRWWEACVLSGNITSFSVRYAEGHIGHLSSLAKLRPGMLLRLLFAPTLKLIHFVGKSQDSHLICPHLVGTLEKKAFLKTVSYSYPCSPTANHKLAAM